MAMMLMRLLGVRATLSLLSGGKQLQAVMQALSDLGLDTSERGRRTRTLGSIERGGDPRLIRHVEEMLSTGGVAQNATPAERLRHIEEMLSTGGGAENTTPAERLRHIEEMLSTGGADETATLADRLNRISGLREELKRR